MQQTKTRALEQLSSLVGTWAMTSRRYSEGRGTTTISPLDDGAFLRLHSEEEHGRFPTSTWIIGGDDADDALTAVTHDNRGVSRVYRMRMVDGVWTIWRDAPEFCQRFTGTLADGGNTIAGQWEFSPDGLTWDGDFDLTYRRVG